MGNAVAIRYDLAVEDLVEFSLFHMNRSKSQQHAQRRGYVIIVICVLIGIFSAGGIGQVYQLFFWFGILPLMAGFAGVLIWWSKSCRLRAVRKAVRRLYSDGGQSGPGGAS